MGRELLLGFLNLSICPKKFSAGCEHSRLDPKPISNQVPVLWVPLFQIYPSLKKAFERAKIEALSEYQKYLSVYENILVNREKK